MSRSITAALVVALCGVSAGVTQAQRFGRGQTPAAGACFYENVDFQGDYFCVRAGDVVESLPRDMNDRISSIRTFGRVEVSVFHDAGGGLGGGFVAGTEARAPGPDPQRRSYASYGSFTDPDGNVWLLQEIKERLPGRV
jgi:hypothetical protein